MHRDHMDRRDFLKAGAGALTLAGCRTATAPGETAGRPNVLFVVSDQQHYQALGAVDPFFDTPHLDALAAESTLFTRAFCTTPQCSASRSSMYTGYYPHRTTVVGNIGSVRHTGEKVAGLPPGFPTAGRILGDAGYHTGYFGKWHLGRAEHFAAQFDESRLNGNAHGGATRRAIAYLEARAAAPGQPFALCVNYINPHDIYHFKKLATQGELGPPEEAAPLPPSWAEDFSGKPAPQQRFMTHDQGEYMVGRPERYWRHYRLFYRDKCRLVDRQVGELLTALRRLGLAENTVVVYVSDHGDMDTQHRCIYKGPFMYEHMVRVPLLMRLPARWGGVVGRRTDEMVSGVDILPTLCALTGASPPADEPGRSLLSLLTGEGRFNSREYVVSEYYNKQKWVNPIRMIRTGRYKYNLYRVHGEELYDLEDDPHELVNRAADPGCAAVKRELAAELRDWRAARGDTEFDRLMPTRRDGAPLS